MPNKIATWNSLAKVGNPMCSKNVNELIRHIKKQECCKQGKESQARCDVAPAEYEQVIELTEADINQPNRYLYSAFFRFQVHLIARVDDVSKVFVADLHPHPWFNFTLVTKLCWSNNVMDERDCPDQIILGAKDWHYCVLLGLAIHLEMWIASGAGAKCSFLFGIHGNENTNATKDNVKNYLKGILNNPQFVRHSEGKLGTHSLHKLACHMHAAVVACKMKQRFLMMEAKYNDSGYLHGSTNPNSQCKSSCHPMSRRPM